MKQKATSVKRWAKKLCALSLDEKGTVSELRVKDVLSVLNAEAPRQHKAILKQYLHYIERVLASSIGLVEHAGDVSVEALDRLKKSLSTHYNRDIELILKPNPSLIAGFRVRLADDVWDLSVQGRLIKLSQTA